MQFQSIKLTILIDIPQFLFGRKGAQNVDSFLKSDDPAIKRFLGVDTSLGAASPGCGIPGPTTRSFVTSRAGIFFHPGKLQALNHKGRYLSVRGPLRIARPIRGWPAIVQASMICSMTISALHRRRAMRFTAGAFRRPRGLIAVDDGSTVPGRVHNRPAAKMQSMNPPRLLPCVDSDSLAQRMDGLCMSLRGPVLKREGGDFEKLASIDADQETSMRTLYLTSLALAIAAGFALPLAGSAEAAMGGALPKTGFLPVENAQMVYLGHNFCWYDGGWQGPGFYWCGYAWNNGNGWGGGEGWHGWNHGSQGARND